MTENTSSDVISQLTAFEMSMAERAAGVSITTLEDDNAPKIDLLGALAWVYVKRNEPSLPFVKFMQDHTLEQITDVLGMDDEDEAAPFPVGADADGTSGAAGDE